MALTRIRVLEDEDHEHIAAVFALTDKSFMRF